MTPETREWLFWLEEWSAFVGGAFLAMGLLSFGVHVAVCVVWRWVR